MPGTLLHDLRLAGRTLLRRKAFAALAILTAGLAIGMTTAVYSTVDWMLNRPPRGVVDPDRLVAVRTTDGESTSAFAFPQYEAIREAQDVFTDLAAYGKIPGVISTDTRSDQVVFEFVTGNYFPMLGLRPALGRPIGPDDDVAGGQPGVMISHAMWRSRFGGDPALVGRTITLNGSPALVIGVVPAGFEGYSVDWNGPTSVWLPMQAFTTLMQSNMLTRTGQGGNFFPLIGRLRPDVSLEAARERAQVWAPLLTAAPNDRYRPTGFVVTSSSQARIGVREPTEALFGVLLIVSALVLVAACFNIANFLIGQAVARRGELAVRSALGATRWRLARQPAMEAAILGVLAGAIGFAVAVMLIRLTAGLPRIFLRVPVTTEAVIDGRMAAVAIGLGLLSAFIFGVVPAALAAVRNPFADLKNPRPGWSWSGVRVSTRQGLLVLQVALAVVLASTAGLYGHSLLKVIAIDSGYESPERVLLARVVLSGIPQGEMFYSQLLPGLLAMPGVVSASVGWNPPYAIGRNFISVPESDVPAIEAGATAAAPGFFETLGIPLVAGREFDGSDGDLQSGVIINQTLASRLWPHAESIVGRRLMYGTQERIVTGVVAEERCRRIVGPPEPCVYQPFPWSTGVLRVRVEGAPMAYADRVRALVHGIDSHVALAEEKALDIHLRDLTAAERISAAATLWLAVLGIVLLGAGCVSLFVSMVRDSVREIAVRMTLGATSAHVTRRIMLQGSVVTLLGLGAGLLATRFVALRLADQLYDVSPWDPTAWVSASALIVAVSLGSVYFAAVLAARTPPSVLLRTE